MNDEKDYTQWLEENEEPIEANPDSLSDENCLWKMNQKSIESKRLKRLLPQILTSKQLEVYNMIYRKGFSERKVASLLKVSHSVIHEQHLMIQKKVKKQMEKYFKGV